MVEREKVTLSDYETKEEMHKVMKSLGFRLKDEEELRSWIADTPNRKQRMMDEERKQKQARREQAQKLREERLLKEKLEKEKLEKEKQEEEGGGEGEGEGAAAAPEL